MRLSMVSGGFLCVLLIGSVANVSAQDRRQSSERRADERADSLRRARAQERSPAEARRQNDQARRDREQAADDTRRRVPANERAPALATPAAPASERPSDTALRGLAGTARADSAAGVLRIINTTPPTAATDSIRQPSRPRAFIMRRTERADAPSFCRSGAGHPLYGRDWCFERGFRLGPDWERDRVVDVKFNRAAGIGRIDRTALEKMLGPSVIQRLEELGYEDVLSANWVETPVGGLVLRVSAGTEQIAELADRNRDGRIDVIWLRSPR